MADLIIEAKRRNLSGLNFSSFGQNLSRQKLSSQGSRVGSRVWPLCKPNRNCLRNKKSNNVKERQQQQQQATVSLVELAIDLTSTLLCSSCCCSIWQSFCLSHFHVEEGGALPCPGSSLEINYTCRSRKYDCHASRRWQIDRERERVEMKPA